MKENEKYSVSCPICGKIIFKTKYSDAEIKCGYCKREFNVEVSESRIVYEFTGKKEERVTFSA